MQNNETGTFAFFFQVCLKLVWRALLKVIAVEGTILYSNIVTVILPFTVRKFFFALVAFELYFAQKLQCQTVLFAVREVFPALWTSLPLAHPLLYATVAVDFLTIVAFGDLVDYIDANRAHEFAGKFSMAAN